METYRLFAKIGSSLINSYVSTESSSIYSDNQYYSSSKLLVWDNNELFHSKSESGGYVRFDFNYGAPYIEKFMLKSAVNRDPLNWVLEGSRDGIHFTKIYTNEGTKLCQWGLFDKVTTGCINKEEKTYELNRKSNYRSIKFKQTGLDSNNQSFIVLSAIDFIGNFHYIVSTYCKQNRRLNAFTFALMMLIY